MRVRARRGGRSTARSAVPAASAATPRRPFTSNHRSFLWPAHTWPTDTQPLAPSSKRTRTVARSSLVIADRLASRRRRLRERLGRCRRLEPRVDDRRQIGEHLDDAPAGDVLDEIAPVRADVADRGARAALVRLEPPGEIGRLEQPVLQVGAVDEMHGAELAARRSSRAPAARAGCRGS